MNILEFNDLNTDDIVFSNTLNGNYSNRYIPIGISNQHNDEVHPLILNSPSDLYTKGVRPIYDRSKENIVGYCMKLSLFNRRKKTEEEENFTKKLNEILEYSKEFLQSIKDELDPPISDSMIENMKLVETFHRTNNVESEAKNRNETDPQPQLYTKLMMNRRSKKISTQFFDESTNELIENPESVVSEPTWVTVALKLENLTITNTRIFFEIKVIEVLTKKIRKTSYMNLKPRLLPGISVKNEQIKKISYSDNKLLDSTPSNTNLRSKEFDNKNTFKNLPLLDEDELNDNNQGLSFQNNEIDS